MTLDPDDGPTPRIVRVDIGVADGAPTTTAARVRVRVEDDSLADASTRIVGEAARTDIELAPGAVQHVDVEVPSELIDDRNRYVVEVHVDVSGSGAIEPGDLITMESYPVLTRGGEDAVCVEVRAV